MYIQFLRALVESFGNSSQFFLEIFSQECINYKINAGSKMKERVDGKIDGAFHIHVAITSEVTDYEPLKKSTAYDEYDDDDSNCFHCVIFVMMIVVGVILPRRVCREVH